MNITLATQILNAVNEIEYFEDKIAGDTIVDVYKAKLDELCKQALRQMVIEAARKEVEEYNKTSKISVGERAWLTGRLK